MSELCDWLQSRSSIDRSLVLEVENMGGVRSLHTWRRASLDLAMHHRTSLGTVP